MVDLRRFPRLKDYQISHPALGDKTIDDYQKYIIACEVWRSEFVAQLELAQQELSAMTYSSSYSSYPYFYAYSLLKKFLEAIMGSELYRVVKSVESLGLVVSSDLLARLDAHRKKFPKPIRDVNVHWFSAPTYIYLTKEDYEEWVEKFDRLMEELVKDG